MANKKISELTLFPTANSTDEIPVNRLGMNGKLTVASLGGGVPSSRTISTTSPLSGGGDLSANRTLSIPQASSSVNGYLSSAHWSIFNGKQDTIAHLEYNNTDLTIWNNGKGNIDTNTSFGPEALKTNTTGYGNTGIGTAALRDNTQGYVNTAVGNGSLAFTTTGDFNTAVGASAAIMNTTGDRNTVLGAFGLTGHSTGSRNIAIGMETSSNNFSDCVLIGNQATANANNQFVVGSSTYNAGSVVTLSQTSTKYWNVIINGVAQRILLA